LTLVVVRPRPGAPRLRRPAALERAHLVADLVFNERGVLRLVAVGTAPRVARDSRDPRVGRHALGHEANRFLAEPDGDADRADADDEEDHADAWSSLFLLDRPRPRCCGNLRTH